MTKTEIQTIIIRLEDAPDLIVPLMRAMPAEKLKKRPAFGKWSVHEHICHLAEVDPLMMRRLDLILSENNPKIDSYDPGRDDDPDKLLKMDLDSAIDHFISNRRKTVHRLKELSEDDWKRPADHEEYSAYSVFIMMRHLAMHDMFHAYRIEEILLTR